MGEWVEAGALQIGDAVVSADGDFGTVDAVVSTDGTAADLAIGVAWDMAVHKQTPSEALFGNLISFGIGFGIGRGISGVGRLAGRNADNVTVRGGQRIDAGDIRRLESTSNTRISESGRIRTERPNGIDPGASLRHPRTWYADNAGGDRSNWRRNEGEPPHEYGLYRYRNQADRNKWYVGQTDDLNYRLRASDKKGHFSEKRDVEYLPISFAPGENPDYWLDVAERIELFRISGGDIYTVSNRLWPLNNVGRLSAIRTLPLPVNWPSDLPIPTDERFYGKLPTKK